jgi:hypothetical protein
MKILPREWALIKNPPPPPKPPSPKRPMTLSYEQAAEIRASNLPNIELAARYKVRPTMISRIKTNRSHMNPPAETQSDSEDPHHSYCN